ncbi:hypothetical protein ACEPAG_8658 [Sanghuangporus baumii]
MFSLFLEYLPLEMSLPTSINTSAGISMNAFPFTFSLSSSAKEVLPAMLCDNRNLILSGAAVALLLVAQYVHARKKDINVPTVGPSGRLTSYLGAIRLLIDARETLQEGYRKYSTFKIPQLYGWLVVVNTPELIEEVRKAPDDKLSFIEATEDNLAVKYTMGSLIYGNHYHVGLVRSQLTRNLEALYDEIYDEVVQAFEDNINIPQAIGGKPSHSEWVSVNAQDMVMKTIARTSNRAFVGLPTCRNEDYIDLIVRYTLDVIKGSLLINMVPDFLKTFVGEFLTSLPRSLNRGVKHLRPVIEYRLAQAEKYGGKDWPGKSNDMLTWLMDDGPENEKRDVRALTQRILTINFASVHTSTLSFTHVLLHLASRPEDIKSLREEAEQIVGAEGWSRASIAKMRKVDSYIKEGLRVHGIALLTLERKAMEEFTLSDGTVLPAGAHVTCNISSVHRDERYYANASEFDGFRFARSASGSDSDSGSGDAGVSKTTMKAEGKKNEESETETRADENTGTATRDQMVSTSTEFLPFGHGRHGCPGRFFAALELKTMLAYLVMTYDMKLDVEEKGEGKGGERTPPKASYFASAVMPDSKARILFRKRSAPAS